MITLLLHLFRVLPVLFGSHRQLALENLALQQQLTVYKRTMIRPRLRRTDRLFWGALARVWADWRRPLVIVNPDTVLRWQRRRFRQHWTKLSPRPTGGRPPVNAEINALVRRMATANPLWGAPRIHAELLKLGIDVSERTVSRLMPKRRKPPSQTWRTFLYGHPSSEPDTVLPKDRSSNISGCQNLGDCPSGPDLGGGGCETRSQRPPGPRHRLGVGPRGDR
jgi:Homeodomain-like domain